MIKFTELRVHKGHLLITAQVREESYYENVYIKKIYIDTQDTFTDDTKPSSNVIYESEEYDSTTKEVHLDLVATDLKNVDMSKTMFFVWAQGDGVVNPMVVPCGFDNEYSLGVTFDLCPIYNETMQYIKEVENECELPKGFINMILQHKAIQYSINSGHYLQAVNYYNKFYKDLSVVTTKPCGCHG